MFYMFLTVPPPFIRSSKLTQNSGKKQKKFDKVPDAVYTVLSP
jgi:hypothetical protein